MTKFKRVDRKNMFSHKPTTRDFFFLETSRWSVVAMMFVDVMMMTHDQILFYYNLEAKLVWLIRA